MDPSTHPDLIEMSQTLARQMEAVLTAEHEAAAITMRRRRTIRDRLLRAEDRAEQVTVSNGSQSWQGTVSAVGADHVVLASGSTEIFLFLDACTAIEFGR